MASMKDQLVKVVHKLKEKWHETEETWKHQVKCLLSRAAADKNKVVMETKQRYAVLMEEKKKVLGRHEGGPQR